MKTRKRLCYGSCSGAHKQTDKCDVPLCPSMSFYAFFISLCDELLSCLMYLPRYFQSMDNGVTGQIIRPATRHVVTVTEKELERAINQNLSTVV